MPVLHRHPLEGSVQRWHYFASRRVGSKPAHPELVYLSGVLEIVGGIAVLVPRVRSAAGWGLVLLLVAIFPANLHMALNPDRFPDISPAALYARLPLQAFLIAWAYWATRPEEQLLL